MTQTIRAVYEAGVLRPLSPLRLVEHQRVQVQIIPEQQQEAVDAIVRELIATGKITPPSGQSDSVRLTDDERIEIAEALGAGGDVKPVSELIIEDR